MAASSWKEWASYSRDWGLARAGDIERYAAEPEGLIGTEEADAAGTVERDGLEMLRPWGDDDETTGRAS
jgi:hypothetical protein